MAVRFPGTEYEHRALRLIGGTSMWAPENSTIVYGVRVNGTPLTYHTAVGLGRESFSGGEYHLAAIGPWGGGSAQNWAISDGTDTAAGAPQIGTWVRQAYRTTDLGGGSWRHRFWADKAGAPTSYVEHDRNSFTLQTDHRLLLGNVEEAWSFVGEPFDGDLEFVKIIAASLSDADADSECGSVTAVTSAGIANLWALYEFPNGANFLNDTSGNARHLEQMTPANPAAWVAGPVTGGSLVYRQRGPNVLYHF